MKIITKKSGVIVEELVDGKKLEERIIDIDMTDTIIRVELRTDEFEKLLHDVDYFEPVGMDYDYPSDYSGCHVIMNNGVCAQTHRKYYE